MSSTSPGRATRAIYSGAANTDPPSADHSVTNDVKPVPAPEKLSPPVWEDPGISVHEGGLKPGSIVGKAKVRVTPKSKIGVKSLWRKDRLVFESYWCEAEINRLIDRLRYLAITEALQPTVSCCNFKSGGKSTVVLYVGSVISEYTRKQVIAVTASSNTDTATLSEMAGIHAQPVSVFATSLEGEKAYRELSRSMKSNKHGLRILGEFDSEDEIEPTYTVDGFRRVVRAITIASDVILFDHGNDNMDVGSDVIPYAAIDYSDVLVFTATASAPISEKTMRRTWRRYARDPRTAEERENLASEDYQEGRLPGLVIPTARKVARSLIVHNGVRPGDETALLEETDEVEMNDASSSNPTRRTMIPWLGRQLDVGFEPYIANKSVPPADLDKISREALRQYLTIAVAIFETSANVTDTKLTKGNLFKNPAGPYQTLS